MSAIATRARPTPAHPRRGAWPLLTALVIIAIAASACSRANAAFNADSGIPCVDDGPPHVGDFVGIRDLEIEPPVLTEGDGFSVNWTRTANQLTTDSVDWWAPALVPGNTSLTVTLNGSGEGLPASVTMPFDYDFPDGGPGAVPVEVDEMLSIDELVPNFADDLTVGTYSVEVALAGDESPLCPPGGSGELLTANFAIGSGPSCPFPDFDVLDLAVNEPTFDAAPPRTVSWATSYLFASTLQAISPVGADITETLTILDPVTGDEIASETIVSEGMDAILVGDVFPNFRTFGDLGITADDVGEQITIRVEVASDQPDAECGATDLEANNTAEITVDVIAP